MERSKDDPVHAEPARARRREERHLIALILLAVATWSLALTPAQ
jgi:hypothetical protein